MPRPALACMLAWMIGATACWVRAEDGPSRRSEPTGIDRLIDDLGAADYATRETAAARLGTFGPAAVDALLTAAETSGDVEVALRAGWLVASLPQESLAIGRPSDPPAALELVGRLATADQRSRVRIMQRLLRLDDDAGVEPLGRIVRLDRSPEAARIAAALLVRDWHADDPFWEGVAARVAAGVGGSGRPAAAFLRGLVAFTTAASATDRESGLALARTAFGQLDRHQPPPTVAEPAGETDADEPPLPDDAPGGAVNAATMQIFRRGLIRMLVAAGRRDDALAEADRLLAVQGRPDADGSRIAADLIWLAEHGLPEAVTRLEARWPQFAASGAGAAYAAGLAYRKLGDAARAQARADAGFERLRGVGNEAEARLQAAVLLVKWGAADWAIREYEAVLDSPTSSDRTFAETGIVFSEFLHDIARHDAAADVLRRVTEGRGLAGDDPADQVLHALGRDPRSVAARRLYFASCDAAARGDSATRRQLLDEAVAEYDKDVDSLIALFHFPENTPAQQAEARSLVERALERIEAEIQALPEDPTGYNEYAWLVSNTEGDVAKAVRYSRLSLEKDRAFDSPSYLDTLAHCRAAAGDFRGAFRTQSLAQRLEPYNRTIKRNLDRFRKQAEGP